MTTEPLLHLARRSARRHTVTIRLRGHTHDLDDTDTRPLPLLGVRFAPTVDALAARVGRRPGVTVAGDRSGRVVAIDGPSAPARPGTPSSLAVDSVRRALGLASEPCARTVTELVAAVWLDRILRATLDAPLGNPPSWVELSRLHPAGRPGPPPSPEGLSHATRRRAPTWRRLRLGTAEGSIRWTGVDPPLADWFDDGSFARHAFAALPEPDVALGELGELLTLTTYERVVCATLSRP